MTGTAGEADYTAALAPVFERFTACLDEIVDTAVARVRAELPEFAEVPVAALREGLPEAFTLGTEAMRTGRTAGAAELKVINTIGARRAEQGFPLDVVLRASRLLAWSALEEFERIAGELDAPPEAMRALVRHYWHWADAALFASATGHHERLLELARDDARERAAFVRRLLRGNAHPVELRRIARHLGLDPDGAYYVVHARPVEPDAGRPVERSLELGGGPGGAPPLVERRAADITAITTRVPAGDGRAYAGVAGPVPLAEIATAFPAATRALATAVAFDLRTPVRPEDHPLELAVTHDRLIGAAAERRCLGPFGVAEERRLMLAETLSTLVGTDLNVRATATRLHVHPNTVRYRIRRFEAATGLRLTRHRDLFLLWWALEHRRIRLRR